MASLEAEYVFLGAQSSALLFYDSPVAADDSFGLQVHVPRVAFPEVVQSWHYQVANLLREDVFLDDAA